MWTAFILALALTFHGYSPDFSFLKALIVVHLLEEIFFGFRASINLAAGSARDDRPVSGVESFWKDGVGLGAALWLLLDYGQADVVIGFILADAIQHWLITVASGWRYTPGLMTALIYLLVCAAWVNSRPIVPAKAILGATLLAGNFLGVWLRARRWRFSWR